MAHHSLNIRIAERSDWPRIIDIYNKSVIEGGKTADTETQSVESKETWLSEHLDEDHPILLGILDDAIIGWCSLSPYRPGRRALSSTLEISYYILEKFRGKGFGSLLIKESIRYASSRGHKNLLAILLDINYSSIRLLEKFGFERWGHFPGIADLGYKKCGQFVYGKNIENNK
jgi:phosphinothricin acetyltransferase